MYNTIVNSEGKCDVLCGSKIYIFKNFSFETQNWS